MICSFYTLVSAFLIRWVFYIVLESIYTFLCLQLKFLHIVHIFIIIVDIFLYSSFHLLSHMHIYYHLFLLPGKQALVHIISRRYLLSVVTDLKIKYKLSIYSYTELFSVLSPNCIGGVMVRGFLQVRQIVVRARSFKYGRSWFEHAPSSTVDRGSSTLLQVRQIVVRACSFKYGRSWVRAHSFKCGRSWIRAPVGSNQRLLNWYLLLLGIRIMWPSGATCLSADCCFSGLGL